MSEQSLRTERVRSLYRIEFLHTNDRKYRPHAIPGGGPFPVCLQGMRHSAALAANAAMPAMLGNKSLGMPWRAARYAGLL